MPTTIHLPAPLIQRLDRIAERKGISRNRLLVEACQALVAADGGEWPASQFDRSRHSATDLMELRAGVEEIDTAIASQRRSRKTSPFDEPR